MPVSARNLRRSLESAVKRRPRLRRAYYRLRGAYHGARVRAAGPSRGSGVEEAVNPENVVWIFSTARSGTTWLRSMLAGLLDCEVWEEPKVAQLFGDFHERAQEAQLGSTECVMGDPTRGAWTAAVRQFVLGTARASHPSMTPERYLVVKEPGGAVGAPLMMEALPESRMVLLVRDPRDVVASVLDAQKEGAWMNEGWDEWKRGRNVSAEKHVNAYARVLANRYVRQMANGKSAFDAHRGRKALVRYEELRVDTLGTVRRLSSQLGLPDDEEGIARDVEAQSWERVAEGEKG